MRAGALCLGARIQAEYKSEYPYTWLYAYPNLRMQNGGSIRIQGLSADTLTCAVRGYVDNRIAVSVRSLRIQAVSMRLPDSFPKRGSVAQLLSSSADRLYSVSQ